MNIKPIGNRVFIEVTKKDEKTISGIILTTTKIENPSNLGVIIAVGDITENINIGDTILFKPDSGVNISHGLIVDVEDILAIVD